MPTDRLPRARQPRLLLLIGMLVLSFVFTAVLAYQAQGAAELHRQAAKRTLRDYAEIVALEFGINAREGMYSMISSVLFQPANLGVGITAHPRVPPLDSAAGRQCRGRPADTTLFFRLELKTRTIPMSRGCASPAVQAWLLDTIPPDVRQQHNPMQDFAYIVGRVEGEPRLVAFSIRRDAGGSATAAFGFVTNFRRFGQWVFRDVFAYYPLLPPSLVGKTRNDSLLSVTITDVAGRELYRSTPQYTSDYTAAITFNKQPQEFGGYIVRATLRPEAAELLVGGIPPSRVSLLLALLVLSAALVVIAVQVLRREYALARLRADFISSVSHELRTPLAQVRMFAETLLLSRVRTDAERRRSLEIINQEARRLTHLVENVLQFSRGERHLTRLAPEPTDIARQVRESVEAFTPIAQARRVTLHMQLLEGVVALVDRAALRQTLLNLLDNAVKYGPAAQTVTTGMTLAGGAVRIWVDDEGPGIMPRERARIWEPFYRLQRDASSAVAGSGIGLAIVREFMDQHGGRVWVENAPTRGARFIIEFPDARITSGPVVTARSGAPDMVPATDTGGGGSSPSEPTTV